MSQDFLVIGQGLAGSLLGYALIENEQTLTIVDSPNPHSASRVAAGMMNPIAGQRMVLSPDVNVCLPHAIRQYRKLAEEFQQQFYFEKPFLRLFKDKRDLDRYRERIKDPAYQAYLGEQLQAGDAGVAIRDPYGGYWQKQSGYLDIVALLNCFTGYFQQQANYMEGNFDYTELLINEEGVSWQGKQYDHVIFCEGAGAVDNPWFCWLPFQLSRGELLTVQSETPLPQNIINKGHWLLPQNEEQARFGATYSWEWEDHDPSQRARDTLLESCSDMLTESDSVRVVKHSVGIRSTTRDKQPFIGTHPRYRQLHCFNGFGSRGAMLIPYYADCLLRTILKNQLLPNEVNIERFLDRSSMVVLARKYISEFINRGDIVVDATVGNGHDTELMARCVGAEGKVYGFDTQELAINNTRQRLQRSGLLKRVTLYQENHARLIEILPSELPQKVSLITFNLGFLPGSDKSCTTQADSTVAALDSSLIMLSKGGSIVLMTYPGHECGKNETKIVNQWLNQLKQTDFQWQSVAEHQNFDAPSLHLITKK